MGQVPRGGITELPPRQFPPCWSNPRAAQGEGQSRRGLLIAPPHLDSLRTGGGDRLSHPLRRCAPRAVCGLHVSIALRARCKSDLSQQQEKDQEYLRRCVELAKGITQTRRGWLGRAHRVAWFALRLVAATSGSSNSITTE